MATYYVTRYKKVKDPQTGQLKTVYYREPVQSQTASLLGEIQNIKTAAESGKAYTTLPSPAAGGEKKIYTSTQLQSLKDIDAAKKAGSDPRTFRTVDPQFGMTGEQQALVGAIDVGSGVIKLGEAGALAKREQEVQPELKQIRQRRRRAVEKEASLLRRQTGRRALLASPTGGSGFFGGYFKG